MQLEVGKIYEGKVTGITKYGAFVELDKDTTGMVHISEVANTFVNEIKDHIQEGQTVKVKVIALGENNKISLSIKRALPTPQGKPKDGHGNQRGGLNKQYNQNKNGSYHKRGGSGNRGFDNEPQDLRKILRRFMMLTPIPATPILRICSAGSRPPARSVFPI